MTAATLHIAALTFAERAGLRIADAITGYVRRRMERRAERRALAIDMLREQQARKSMDPFVLEQAMQMIGSRSR
ncbi:MAG: hypothetical protein B7X41_05980 [Microbacterium sp. 14-71-5]|jgi:hypothetical protein|uniref:hypothetical protein n=1 Tax=Microbacterium sp. 13-71-7 TaxID=1970399 RepID=UPI000BD3770E|nr:hypothetical protein [Microbacterium sp. 13-71-7]OZB79984.1 MAG: hypothetical protein B7X32_20260 [Microbacterium sp. 13-71-7]OZB88849.1 MAG: hypothetical protein B7X41_05980 [Microbacterium sp. 14-71-5]